jgi:hypothetical protein
VLWASGALLVALTGAAFGLFVARAARRDEARAPRC